MVAFELVILVFLVTIPSAAPASVESISRGRVVKWPKSVEFVGVVDGPGSKGDFWWAIAVLEVAEGVITNMFQKEFAPYIPSGVAGSFLGDFFQFGGGMGAAAVALYDSVMYLGPFSIAHIRYPFDF